MLRWKCPVCGESCIVRSSKQPIAALRIIYLQCTDIECGWRGKGACEIIESLPGHKFVNSGQVSEAS